MLRDIKLALRLMRKPARRPEPKEPQRIHGFRADKLSWSDKAILRIVTFGAKKKPRVFSTAVEPMPEPPAALFSRPPSPQGRLRPPLQSQLDYGRMRDRPERQPASFLSKLMSWLG